MRHRRYKCAGLQGPCGDCRWIVALQGESKSGMFCLVLFVIRMFEHVDLGLLQVMKWFWAVVSSFTQEELARLLQFTTGSSQLPPGGFNTLCPSFQIIAAPTHSTLPTAHTWSVRKHRKTQAWDLLMSDKAGHSLNIFHRNIDLMANQKCLTEAFMVPMFLLIFGEFLIFPHWSSFLRIQGQHQGATVCCFSWL